MKEKVVVKLTVGQQSRKYVHDQNKCDSCRYADQEAIKKYESCCTYAGKLVFNVVNICLTRQERNK